MPRRALVVGLGATGRAVTRHLVTEGWTVVVVEDHPTEHTDAAARQLGAEVGPVEAAAAVDLVVPSPGVPPDHAVHAAAAAAGVPVVSEVELAWRAAGSRPIVAITGTNGKTTVTTLVAAMLVESGRKAVAAGNIGLAMIDAVTRDVDVIVAEVSSFQLQYTQDFRPSVAAWLNMAPDHLDWHPSLEHYRAAKERIWANQDGDDVAVVNVDDPAVREAALSARGRIVTFGRSAEADYRLAGDMLCGPGGAGIVARGDLARSMPHDVSNALAAFATAVAAGAELAACRSAVVGFEGLPHRLQLVGEAGGVRYYDDSKATSPAAVLAALRAFDSVVLVAGGRNKGLDLGELRQETRRLRAVVAIGEAAPELIDTLGDAVAVTAADSMDEAVLVARQAAHAGDAVVLSPGCASFDWYSSYAERGKDFSRAVRRLPLMRP